MERNAAILAIAGLFCGATHGVCAAEALNTLYAFGTGADVVNPAANIAIDSAGNIFGAAANGGTNGFGGVFQILPPAGGGTVWTEKVLWSFVVQRKGRTPLGGVIEDKHGNLYGTTYAGGSAKGGTAFELKRTASGYVEKVLWSFVNYPSDGWQPSAALALGGDGSLYGNTDAGGYEGYGSAFRLTPPAPGSKTWSESIIWSFYAGVDGWIPSDQPVLDAAGNVYGTAYRGGTHETGSVWELSPPQGQNGWNRTVLWNFSETAGGPKNPTRGPLVIDANGNIYGTCHFGGKYGYGTVFMLSPQPQAGWKLTNIWSFTGGADGGNPTSGPVMARDGSLVIPTAAGNGTIVQLVPPQAGNSAWTEKTLYSFTGGNDGSDPEAPVVLGANGAIFGTAQSGGANGNGTVWELTP